ncbi:hypothetical protein NEFER03_0522 [Nematocida sp. LUAm3]|nr:hypothetical protein NEFER03_0522 [Nematocida sp. LUAm3]KAI5175489.1 hypothetical protein NEFER02_1395 [Nematocida sp. LUAm2]KAI5178481.1 hypothetical protein NEFER01_1628 [Nematocida sp. LUAm1]
MATIVCIVCQTKHRTREMYKKHIERKEHIEKQKENELWYANRLEGNRGVFFQTQIFDVQYIPSYSVKVYKEQKKIELLVDRGESGVLQLFFKGDNVNDGESFEYFDAALSIYTIQLVIERNASKYVDG